jgi:hypothetical protein
MQIAAKDSRILVIETLPHLGFAADVATRQAAFYQHIVIGQAVLRRGQIDAERLISIGVMAHRQRRVEIINAVSSLLDILPIGGRYRLFARYFEGLGLYLNKNFTAAKVIFENLLPSVHGKLKARTLMALAAVAHDSKEESSLPYYLEAGSIAAQDLCDPYTVVQAGRMIAINKSINGDHQGAVNDLEKLTPIANTISKLSPFLLCEYLNSLAVEKGEIGHYSEGLEIARFLMASPYSAACPEYRETHDEIVTKAGHASRSIVALNVLQSKSKP